MVSVLVDHVFQLVVFIVDDVVVVVSVVQHGAVPLGAAVLFQVFSVRFRLEPEHFHFVRIHVGGGVPIAHDRFCAAAVVGGKSYFSDGGNRSSDRRRSVAFFGRESTPTDGRDGDASERNTVATRRRRRRRRWWQRRRRTRARERRRGRSARDWFRFSFILSRFTVWRSSGRRPPPPPPSCPARAHARSRVWKGQRRPLVQRQLDARRSFPRIIRRRRHDDASVLSGGVPRCRSQVGGVNAIRTARVPGRPVEVCHSNACVVRVLCARRRRQRCENTRAGRRGNRRRRDSVVRRRFPRVPLRPRGRFPPERRRPPRRRGRPARRAVRVPEAVYVYGRSVSLLPWPRDRVSSRRVVVGCWFSCARRATRTSRDGRRRIATVLRSAVYLPTRCFPAVLELLRQFNNHDVKTRIRTRLLSKRYGNCILMSKTAKYLPRFLRRF